MNKELIEQAKKYIKPRNLPESNNRGVRQLQEIVDMATVTLLADFAATKVRERELEIARKLRQIANEARNDVEEWNKNVRAYIEELEGEK